MLLGSASGLIISNAWTVASDRAVKAGKRCWQAWPRCAAGHPWEGTHSAGMHEAAQQACLPPAFRTHTTSALPHTSPAPTLPRPPPSPPGKLLAHLLLSGAHGDRPVKLVSHGMGARLVFHCLLELCRQGARGVVQVRWALPYAPL